MPTEKPANPRRRAGIWPVTVSSLSCQSAISGRQVRCGCLQSKWGGRPLLRRCQDAQDEKQRRMRYAAGKDWSPRGEGRFPSPRCGCRWQHRLTTQDPSCGGDQLLCGTATLPSGSEACSASRHWPRMRSTQLGHDVRMMPARYVKAALGACRSDAGVGQAAIVLGRLKPAVRRLRRWPSARLDQAARRR